MKIPTSVLKGLQEVYGDTGRTIWCYTNNRGSVRYSALREGEQPPENFPNQADHVLVGRVNFERGEVIASRANTPSVELATQFAKPLLVAVFKLLKLALVAAIAIGVAFVAIAQAFSGGRR